MQAENYSKKEYYWQRRNIATALFDLAFSRVPDREQLQQELKSYTDQILKRHKKFKYRCVYVLRENQNFDQNSQEDGGYYDSWWRSAQYNLGQDENMTDLEERQASEENAIPLKDSPVVIYLKPPERQYYPSGEFVECIHPECQKLNNNNQMIINYVGHRGDTMYLFCKKHAEDRVISILEQFLAGKEIPIEMFDATGISIKLMIENHLTTLINQAHKSFLDCIEHSKKDLENEIVPDRVLEVSCDPFPENEDSNHDQIIIYVDLIDCRKIRAHVVKDF
jgi:hypothetical protein